MELQEYKREQLLDIIPEQNKQIHTLTAERALLIEENNLQREIVAKRQQKIAEWQNYAQYRKLKLKRWLNKWRRKRKNGSISKKRSGGTWYA